MARHDRTTVRGKRNSFTKRKFAQTELEFKGNQHRPNAVSQKSKLTAQFSQKRNFTQAELSFTERQARTDFQVVVKGCS
eukprot:4233627-Amphidinium_carterae.1